jgi:hypothetical protein
VLVQGSWRTGYGFQTAISKVRYQTNRNVVVVAISIISLEVSRAALADSKATIADVTKLRWEIEGRELEAHQQLAVVVAERDDLKSKLLQQQDDNVQVSLFLLHVKILRHLMFIAIFILRSCCCNSSKKKERNKGWTGS